MNLAIFGADTAGTSVAKLASDYGHTITVFADSQSAVIDSKGVDIDAALAMKQSGGVIGDTNPDDAIRGQYDVLIETPAMTSDAESSFSYLQAALERGRHAVLSNKEVVAKCFKDIRALEAKSEGQVRFGATVGGATPVLPTINDVGPKHITAVRGVFDGTTNFILSRMAAERLDYEHVLAEAQDLGVAEADPSFSVGGTNTALSCMIVANILAKDNGEITLDDVYTEGISNIPSSALELAREDGHTVRLIGEIVGTEVRVAPRLISENAALAVSGMNSIIQLETEHTGHLNISGSSASGPGTASFIFTDISHLG